MRFIISHFLNEEYLLKWWLPHHKNKFDHGIMIDYGSTDGSVELVKKICPTWQVIRSRNNNFKAIDVDMEVLDIEVQIQRAHPRSWVIALNSTEFFVGNTEKLINGIPFSSQKLVAGQVMVDTPEQMWLDADPNLPLVHQRSFGVPLEFNVGNSLNPHLSKLEKLSHQEKVLYSNRGMRSLHNYVVDYRVSSMWGVGRHFWGDPCEDFKILWYGYSPYTESLIDRQLAIKKTIPPEDAAVGNGVQHQLTREDSLNRFYYHQRFAIDLKDEIEKLEK